MSHEALVEMAAASATSRPLDPFLPKHISERRKTALMQAIKEGLGVAPEAHPALLRNISRRPGEQERKRFLELQKRRDASAAALGIDPTLIASRAVLSDLAHDWEKYENELMNWQRQLLKV
jgi:ribonuclease D